MIDAHSLQLIVDNETQADLEGSSPFVSASSPSTLLEFSQSVLSNESGLGEDGPLSVEVDCEVTTLNRSGDESSKTNETLVNNDSFPDREMARSKQTLRKSGQDYNKYRGARFGKLLNIYEFIKKMMMITALQVVLPRIVIPVSPMLLQTIAIWL